MTTADVIKHWQKGAKDALRVAVLAHQEGAEELALFNCHLAIEKTLKAAIMQKTGKPHPKVHNLGRLALVLQPTWPEEDRELFDTLSDFAVSARYDDPGWAEQYATAKNTKRWIDRTTSFLSKNFP